MRSTSRKIGIHEWRSAYSRLFPLRVDSIDGTAVRAIRPGNVSGNPAPKTVTNASHLALALSLSVSLSLFLSPLEDRFDARKQKENEKGEVEKRKDRERERERERVVIESVQSTVDSSETRALPSLTATDHHPSKMDRASRM